MAGLKWLQVVMVAESVQRRVVMQARGPHSSGWACLCDLARLLQCCCCCQQAAAAAAVQNAQLLVGVGCAGTASASCAEAEAVALAPHQTDAVAEAA